MNHHSYFAAGEDRPVETCVVGSGGFGRSFLAQSLRMDRLSTRVAVDIEARRAGEALASLGIERARIRECASAAEAKAAWDAGHFIASDDLAHVLDLPIEVVVEATGHPEAGARHGRLAIEADKHLAMVSKEVESVIGPGLAALARERGRVSTPVDGDQPSLLIGLVTWAEVLGFEIVAAGKSSEYDFVFDAPQETLTCNGVTRPAPGFARLMKLEETAAREMAEARESAIRAAGFSPRTVPDLCEMSVVANATGLSPDRSDFHATLARTQEMPSFFCRQEDGGLFAGTRRIDVFNCLRRPDDLSFAGGVFVVVTCEDAATWNMLAEKGHVLSRNGATAMLYLPRHLLGLEAPISVLEAARLGRSSGAEQPRPHLDLVAVAEADLPAGHLLEMGGHHHSVERVGAALLPAAPLTEETPAPFYLVSNRRLTRPVRRGETIRLADVKIPEASELLALRRRQDAIFF